MSDHDELIDRLAEHRTIGSAPREELAWLAEHGHTLSLKRGDLMSAKAHRVESMFILLSGHVVIRVDRGAGLRKVMEWRGGDVSGLLPYSRMAVAPGDSVADEPSEALAIPAASFREMTHCCPTVTATLVHVMLDRARQFVSSDLHDEKMMSLGRLSAGLAHELNNPASAAVRGAKLLGEALAEVESAARALAAETLTEVQRQAVDHLRTICMEVYAPLQSPIERADREEAISDWLADNDADPAVAGSLAETAVSLADLERFAAELAPAELRTPLRWIAAGCTVRALAAEIERATSRMYELVATVKRFTHMDRSPTAAVTDLREGLADTVRMLGAKARAKSVAVDIRIERDLPRVRTFGGELNQVWLNLIDNALDAVGEAGHVSVSAVRELSSVVVRFVDDGHGISAEEQPQVFDPFFTTKPVGQGTGLGLDIARRLVRRHEGEIEVESRPGHTEFRVILPAVLNPPPVQAIAAAAAAAP